jgi:hypothetical protein
MRLKKHYLFLRKVKNSIETYYKDNTVTQAFTITVNEITDPTKGPVRLANGTPISANQILTIAELQQLVFAPTANANGAAGTFSYTVNDGNGGTASQTVTLNITPVNDAPIVNADCAATITLSGNSYQ